MQMDNQVRECPPNCTEGEHLMQTHHQSAPVLQNHISNDQQMLHPVNSAAVMTTCNSQQQQPHMSTQVIQMTKQKLKHTGNHSKTLDERSSSSQRAKRAQSIDWTNQDPNIQQQQQITAQVNAMHANEDYYSVPRKCHRAVSSNYLDQDVHSTGGASWATDPKVDLYHFSSVPQPPPSPPPSPPYQTSQAASWAASTSDNGDGIARADSISDMARFY